jgi:long-chain acyl-CoA synthetase
LPVVLTKDTLRGVAASTLQPESLLPHAAARADEEVVWTPDRSLTGAAFEDRARRVANGLRAGGIGPGEPFGILVRNRVEWPELVFGNLRNGSRYLPLNWHLTAAELAELLRDATPRLLVVGPEDEDRAREAAAAAGTTRVLVLGQEYEAWLADQSDSLLPDGQIGAPLLYTGGTTGRSKGVVRSDESGLVSQLGLRAQGYHGLIGMPADGNALLCTPAYHALGYTILAGTMLLGNTLSILPRWDPLAALATIEERRITATGMVPTQFVRLLKLPEADRRRFDVSSLQWVFHTAAACPKWVKRAMIEWFGPVIVEIYGSSEGTGPVVCTSEDWLAHPGTVGRASPVITLSIVGEDGNDLPAGEIGMIYVKRHDGTPSYHNDPVKTEAIRLPDGRFTVGDLGWLDDDGYLYVADRRVDLILRGGSNVYPAEIEAVLTEHPAVADAAVFGIPDGDMGHAIKAVVEPVDAHAGVDVEDLLAYASGRLASYKLPQSVDVVAQLPREASGKLKKRLLRDPYWEGAAQS